VADAARLQELAEPSDVRDLLLQISREMAGAESLDQLLQTMVNAALRIVPAADKCVIHFLDSGGSVLRARVCSQPSFVREVGSGIPANAGIAGRALRERMTLCVDDVGLSSDFVPLHSGTELRSLLVAPLYVADIPLGTLSLSSDHSAAFSNDDRGHTRTLAAQASVAIHQAKLLLEAITERERSEAIIESMADGLVILDGARQIIGVNPALREMLELAPDELSVPCTLDQASPCPERLRLLLDPSGGQVLGPYELGLELPSKTRATFRVTPSPLHAPALGEVRIVHDNTPERSLAEARALLTWNIAHELRGDLGRITVFAGLVNDFDDLRNEDYRPFLRQIEDEVKRLTRLVEDLEQLSRIETGRFSVRREPIRMDVFIYELVNKLIPSARLKGFLLQLNNASQPLWSSADPLRLEQVLSNLVENAFKYVPSGTQITVSVEHSDTDIVVHVADQGPGISAEDRPHVFDCFYQARADARRRNTGSGLGLYISHEIIQAHGGNIWVKSDLGMGSTFSFRLPRVSEGSRTES